MGTKLEELRNGCFARALDDEPMFVLLARDPDAPRLARNWAAQREDEITRHVRPASDMADVLHARQTATDMEKWRKANDGAWRTGLFADADWPSRAPARGGSSHLLRQESDEYACSCGMRWDVAEGDDHP